MRDNDDRAVADVGAHLAENLDEILKTPKVDPRLGLVEDRQFRSPCYDRRDLDPFEFPARQTVVHLAVDVLLRAEPDERKVLARLGDRGVLPGREPEQVEYADALEAHGVLKREGDPRPRALGDVLIRNILAFEEDRARRRALDPRDQFGKRRFPPAVRPRDDEQFPVGNHQGDVAKDLFPSGVVRHVERQVFDFQHRYTSFGFRLRIAPLRGRRIRATQDYNKPRRPCQVFPKKRAKTKNAKKRFPLLTNAKRWDIIQYAVLKRTHL